MAALLYAVGDPFRSRDGLSGARRGLRGPAQHQPGRAHPDSTGGALAAGATPALASVVFLACAAIVLPVALRIYAVGSELVLSTSQAGPTSTSASHRRIRLYGRWYLTAGGTSGGARLAAGTGDGSRPARSRPTGSMVGRRVRRTPELAAPGQQVCSLSARGPRRRSLARMRILAAPRGSQLGVRFLLRLPHSASGSSVPESVSCGRCTVRAALLRRWTRLRVREIPPSPRPCPGAVAAIPLSRSGGFASVFCQLAPGWGCGPGRHRGWIPMHVGGEETCSISAATRR